MKKTKLNVLNIMYKLLFNVISTKIKRKLSSGRIKKKNKENRKLGRKNSVKKKIPNENFDSKWRLERKNNDKSIHETKFDLS